MKNRLFLFINLLYTPFAISQISSNYWTEVSCELVIHGYPELADSVFYTKAYLPEKQTISARSFMLFAENSNKLKDSLRSSMYLIEAIKRGALIESINAKMKRDTLLQFRFWQQGIHKYDSLHLIYEKSLDRKAIDFFQNLDTQERSIRKLQSYLKSKLKDSLLYSVLDSIDKRNTVMVREAMVGYLLKNGLPHIKDVGYSIIDKWALMIWHYCGEVDTAYQTLSNVINTGLYTKGLGSIPFGRIYDVTRRLSHGKEIYGSEFFIKDSFGNKQYYGFEDINCVDELRKEVGIAPLYFHSLRWNYPLPPEYFFDIENFIKEIRLSLL